MRSNKDVLKIAQRYLGEDGARFRKFAGLPNGASYCNAYVDYVAYQGDVENLYFNGKKETYCPHSIKWCAKHLAQIPIYLALPMDIIYFDWEKNGKPNHIGFVVSKKSTTEIRTIEGNTSGGIVAEKNRTADYVQGVFRPHYTGDCRIGELEIDGEMGYNTIANLRRALGMSISAVLSKTVVKNLQRRAGCKAIDGAWGPETSRKVNVMTGAGNTSTFGPAQVKYLQRWINKQAGESRTIPNKPNAKGYKGKYPDLVQHGRERIVQVALELSYPTGTPASKYKYGVGKPKPAYKKALNDVYPDRSSWSAQCRAGASCDVGAGTILRYAGIDKTISRALSKQIPHIQNSDIWKKTGIKSSKKMKPGDVGIYTHYGPGGHIWIGIGKGKIVEANHTAKYFLHVDNDKITSKGMKVWGIYRSQKVKALRKGDKTKQVKRLKKFLNWYGGYGLRLTNVFGNPTEKAVKDFQRRNGLEADGVFGSAELKKAKAVRK